MELLIGFTQWGSRICRVCALGFGELGLETLQPIGTTRRVHSQLGFGTATCLTKEFEMLFLCARGRVLLTIAWIGDDICLLRSLTHNMPLLITILLTTENSLPFLGDFAFETFYGVG